MENVVAHPLSTTRSFLHAVVSAAESFSVCSKRIDGIPRGAEIEKKSHWRLFEKKSYWRLRKSRIEKKSNWRQRGRRGLRARAKGRGKDRGALTLHAKSRLGELEGAQSDSARRTGRDARKRSVDRGCEEARGRDSVESTRLDTHAEDACTWIKLD
eukprot:5572367-Pleurochrysis_carterae.AAC.1